MNVSRKEKVVYALIFVLGFALSYSASAAVGKPTNEDWDAYNSLTKVKIKRVDPLRINVDLNRLEKRSERYAQKLPMQLKRSLSAIQKRKYRYTKKRKLRHRKARRNGNI